MARGFEIRRERDVAGTPDEVWDAITRHAVGWLWAMEFEPRVGGAERGLSPRGGRVTVWDPPHRFRTEAPLEGGTNELTYELEPTAAGTHMRYTHRSVAPDETYDAELDACERHTSLYQHSLAEYVARFAGRDAVRVSAGAPDGDAAAVRRALGLPDDLAVGDRVRIAPDGLEPIEGVVDYLDGTFLGVRSDDALLRIVGRDPWGWGVEVVQHLFDPAADAAAAERAWTRLMETMFAIEEAK